MCTRTGNHAMFVSFAANLEDGRVVCLEDYVIIKHVLLRQLVMPQIDFAWILGFSFNQTDNTGVTKFTVIAIK